MPLFVAVHSLSLRNKWLAICYLTQSISYRLEIAAAKQSSIWKEKRSLIDYENLYVQKTKFKEEQAFGTECSTYIVCCHGRIIIREYHGRGTRHFLTNQSK